MKATDLMVNDLVQVDGVVRIATIRTGAVYDYMNKEYSIGCIKPIPITHRILEKNGWEKRGRPYEWRESIMVQRWNLPIDKGGFLINDCPKYDGFTWHDIELKYVHQLQHALRLCGLDELADGFKI